MSCSASELVFSTPLPKKTVPIAFDAVCLPVWHTPDQRWVNRQQIPFIFRAHSRTPSRTKGVRWATLSGASSNEQKVEETTMIQLMRTEPRLAPVREMLNSLADGFAGSSMPGSLPLDIVETPDSYEVYASVPGLTRDQMTVEVEKGILTISTVVNEMTESPESSNAPTNDLTGCGCSDDLNGDGCCMLRRERFISSAKRSLRLPADVDDASITASLDRGVLVITVQKPTDETPTQVTID